MSMLAGGRGLRAEMNVTPFVDVLLVLIIIFMMIQPRTNPRGLQAEVPQPPNPEQPHSTPEATIVLEISQSGDDSVLYLNRESVPWPTLAARLRDIYKTRATKVMFIRGGKEVEFTYIARAMDEARAADSGIAIGLLGPDAAAD